MKKLFSIAAGLLLTFILIGCSNSNTDKKGSRGANPSKVSHKASLNYHNFQSIKVGSFVDNSGSTSAYVRKVLGKPSSVTTTKVSSGKEVKSYLFSRLSNQFKAKDVTVTFENDRVVSKGFSNSDINKLSVLNNNKINSIKIGNSYNSVIEKLGQPSAESESASGGTPLKTVVYLTGENGKSISLVFSNDKVTQITNSELK